MFKKLVIIFILVVLVVIGFGYFLSHPGLPAEFDDSLQQYTVDELNRENFPILPADSAIRVNVTGFLTYQFYVDCRAWESEHPCPTPSIILSDTARSYILRPETLRADEVSVDIARLSEKQAAGLVVGEKYDVTVRVGADDFELVNYRKVNE